MSIKNKLFSILTVVLLMFASVLPAYAVGGSQDENYTQIPTSTIDEYYSSHGKTSHYAGGQAHFVDTEEAMEDTTMTLDKEYEDVEDEKVLDDISRMDAGESPESVLGEEYAGYSLLTPFQDVNVYVNGEKYEKPVGLWLEVPNLTTDMKKEDLSVLYYNVKEGKWELAEVEDIIYELNAINVDFNCLCPVAILYKAPQAPVSTGVQNNTTLYSGLAVLSVFAMAGIVVYKKKEN